MKPETKKLLKGLDPADVLELEHALHLSKAARKYVAAADITKKEFAKRMGITPRSATNYLDGTYPYSINDIVSLEILQEELFIQQAKEDAQLFTVPAHSRKKKNG